MAKTVGERMLNAALIITVPAALIAVLLRVVDAGGRSATDTDPVRIANWRQLATVGQREGPSGAATTVVWFSDFQCPYCKNANTLLVGLQRSDRQHLAIVHRHFPLSFHPQARLAAIGAVCAEKQGRFAAMRDTLFATAESLGAVSLFDVARRAGIADSGAFDACLRDPSSADVVTRDSVAAAGVGFRGTPGIIVNGWAFAGLPGDSALARAVRRGGR